MFRKYSGIMVQYRGTFLVSHYVSLLRTFLHWVHDFVARLRSANENIKSRSDVIIELFGKNKESDHREREGAEHWVHPETRNFVIPGKFYTGFRS